jgi:hypothetical protein
MRCSAILSIIIATEVAIVRVSASSVMPKRAEEGIDISVWSYEIIFLFLFLSQIALPVGDQIAKPRKPLIIGHPNESSLRFLVTMSWIQ